METEAVRQNEDEKVVKAEQVQGCLDKNYIGKYTVVRFLGEGGEGKVYLARDEELQRMVAIKLMWADTEKWKNREKRVTSENTEEERKIIQEADFLQCLRHPMLPVVYDLVWDDAWYLVMEYIQGITLRGYIDRNGYVREEQACKWTEQLLDIMEYLHTRKPPIIYRDLKPDNIMVCPDGHLRLIDFGAACRRGFGAQERGAMAATVGFGAPEQFGKTGSGFYADERSDIYALGKVMYYMVTGADLTKPPYTALSVRDYQPLVHERLERIICKCIAEDPKQRYQMAEEVSKDLVRCGGGKHRLRRRSFIRIVEKKIWLTEM